MNDNDNTTLAALNALRERGVDSPETLLSFGTPAQIIAACHRWDRLPGVRKNLLVKWIRDGDFDAPEAAAPVAAPSKAANMRARFDEYAARFPEDSVAEPHARLQARRYPEDEPCAGSLIVIETTYPLISVECDTCDYTAAYPIRSLQVLDGQANEAPF